jgi:hypothetical protein
MSDSNATVATNRQDNSGVSCKPESKEIFQKIEK